MNSYRVIYKTADGQERERIVEAPTANSAKNVAMLQDETLDTVVSVTAPTPSPSTPDVEALERALLITAETWEKPGPLANPDLGTLLRAAVATLRETTEALRVAEEERDEAIERAWGIIANANGGDWEKSSPIWQGAAAAWRDRFAGPWSARAAALAALRRQPEDDR